MKLELVVLRRRVETSYCRRKIFVLRTVRSATKEQTTADDVATARFEKVPEFDVIDFEIFVISSSSHE